MRRFRGSQRARPVGCPGFRRVGDPQPRGAPGPSSTDRCLRGRRWPHCVRLPHRAGGGSGSGGLTAAASPHPDFNHPSRLSSPWRSRGPCWASGSRRSHKPDQFSSLPPAPTAGSGCASDSYSRRSSHAARASSDTSTPSAHHRGSVRGEFGEPHGELPCWIGGPGLPIATPSLWAQPLGLRSVGWSDDGRTVDGHQQHLFALPVSRKPHRGVSEWPGGLHR